VHRHPDDTFYGGGAWPLLSALLGMHYAALGRGDDALRQLLWTAAQARPDGGLPEQVSEARPPMVDGASTEWRSDESAHTRVTDAVLAVLEVTGIAVLELLIA
jgi:hypothetical protein